METIDLAMLDRLCERLFDDIDGIHAFNPGLSKREAFFWMLMGTLINLLSVPVAEQTAVFDAGSSNAYFQGVLKILGGRVESSAAVEELLARYSNQL